VPTAAPTMHTVTISQTVRLETLSTSSFSENAFIDSINLHAASACTRAGLTSQTESVSTSISSEADLQSSSGSSAATGSSSSVSLVQTFGHRDNVVPEIAALQMASASGGNISDLSVTYTTTVQTANNPTSNQLSSIGSEMDNQVMSSVCSDMSSYCSNHTNESPCVGCSNSSVTSASDVSSDTVSALSVAASTSDSSSGISTGLVVGFGVGVCLLIALIILLIYCCCLKNATTSDSQDTPGEDKAALLQGEQKKGEGTGEEIKASSPRPEHVGAEVASDGVSSDVHEQHMETKHTLEDCGLVFESHGEITVEGTVATVGDNGLVVEPKVQEESNEENLTVYTVEGTIEDSAGIPEEQL